MDTATNNSVTVDTICAIKRKKRKFGDDLFRIPLRSKLVTTRVRLSISAYEIAMEAVSLHEEAIWEEIMKGEDSLIEYLTEVRSARKELASRVIEGIPMGAGALVGVHALHHGEGVAEDTGDNPEGSPGTG